VDQQMLQNNTFRFEVKGSDKNLSFFVY